MRLISLAEIFHDSSCQRIIYLDSLRLYLLYDLYKIKIPASSNGNAARNSRGKSDTNYVEITSSFEISFIQTVRLLYDVPPRFFALLLLCVSPSPRLYIFGDCDSSSAVTSRIRKNDVPDDTMSVLRTDSYCQLLLAYTLWFQPVVEKVTKFHLEEAAGTCVFHCHPTNSVSIFAFRLEVNASETYVKLFGWVMLIITEHSYPRDSSSNFIRKNSINLLKIKSLTIYGKYI